MVYIFRIENFVDETFPSTKEIKGFFVKKKKSYSTISSRLFGMLYEMLQRVYARIIFWNYELFNYRIMINLFLSFFLSFELLFHKMRGVLKKSWNPRLERDSNVYSPVKNAGILKKVKLRIASSSKFPFSSSSLIAVNYPLFFSRCILSTIKIYQRKFENSKEILPQIWKSFPFFLK